MLLKDFLSYLKHIFNAKDVFIAFVILFVAGGWGVALYVVCRIVPSAIGYLKYNKSSYHLATHKAYIDVVSDKGCYGEYLLSRTLARYEKAGARVLYNLYLPANHGRTTELDLLLICEKGIFVFENKNYSGWIFGTDTDKTWTQTLPTRRGVSAHKEHFLNPVYQNDWHIRWLKEIVGNELSVYSVVVFSERCTFKDVVTNRRDAYVVKRHNVTAVVDGVGGEELTKEQINSLYLQLVPFSQVDASVKRKHIEDVQRYGW